MEVYIKCEKLFQNSDKIIIRELKIFVEDLEKIFIIDHEQLQFHKNSGWTLIGIPKKPDGTFSDHVYFCIHDDIFDRIQ